MTLCVHPDFCKCADNAKYKEEHKTTS